MKAAYGHVLVIWYSTKVNEDRFYDSMLPLACTVSSIRIDRCAILIRFSLGFWNVHLETRTA